MKYFRTKIEVSPNTIGYLYKNNQFVSKLDSGTYHYWGNSKQYDLYELPIVPKFILVTNQEVLSKDNIAFRFSFTYSYRISDGDKFLSNFPLNKNTAQLIFAAENRLSNILQFYIRQIISQHDSESLNENRQLLVEVESPALQAEVAQLGIEVEQLRVRDLTFPKQIQELFSKQLEAKIRAKTDLENARTAVASARALKNASELMKDDDNIKFFQLIETISKIAEKGKHTFMIGDFQQYLKK